MVKVPKNPFNPLKEKWGESYDEPESKDFGDEEQFVPNLDYKSYTYQLSGESHPYMELNW